MENIEEQKDLSVIIVSYKSLDLLLSCLGSIKKYNDIGSKLEVIVSDNSPDMEVFNYLKNHYRWVNVIKNENNGFGAGNNRGVEISSGKYLLFLNPDTVLIEPIFSFAVKKFNDNKDLALFGYQLISKKGKENPSFYMLDHFGITATIYEKFCRKHHKYVDGEMYIAGADLFVRRRSFDEAGRFDENIFMYDEEPDLIKRIKQKAESKRTAFFPEKHIIHLEGGTCEKDTESELRLRKRITKADEYYAAKWNIDIRKMLKAKRRYINVKSFVYLFLNREKHRRQVEINKYFKDEIRKLSHN